MRTGDASAIKCSIVPNRPRPAYSNRNPGAIAAHPVPVLLFKLHLASVLSYCGFNVGAVVLRIQRRCCRSSCIQRRRSTADSTPMPSFYSRSNIGAVVLLSIRHRCRRSDCAIGAGAGTSFGVVASGLESLLSSCEFRVATVVASNSLSQSVSSLCPRPLCCRPAHLASVLSSLCPRRRCCRSAFGIGAAPAH